MLKDLKIRFINPIDSVKFGYDLKGMYNDNTAISKIYQHYRKGVYRYDGYKSNRDDLFLYCNCTDKITNPFPFHRDSWGRCNTYEDIIAKFGQTLNSKDKNYVIILTTLINEDYNYTYSIYEIE